MKSVDFVERLHESLTEFLDEVQLSKYLMVSTNPLVVPESNISSAIAVSPLQKYILNLQGLIEEVNASTDNELNQSDTKSSSSTNDPELVQIVASNTEIERRIEAFMKRKQVEVDEANCREFCSVIDSTSQESSSCARTESVFIPRNGTKSHVKVSRVAHAYGPQTRPHLIKAENVRLEPSWSPRKRGRDDGIEERLQNTEYFLKLRRGRKVPEDVYQRLKSVEERILELESLSPEYFTISPSAFKRQRPSQSTSEDTDLNEINTRIKQLEDSLKRKKGKSAESSPTEVTSSPTEIKPPIIPI